MHHKDLFHLLARINANSRSIYHGPVFQTRRLRYVSCILHSTRRHSDSSTATYNKLRHFISRCLLHKHTYKILKPTTS